MFENVWNNLLLAVQKRRSFNMRPAMAKACEATSLFPPMKKRTGLGVRCVQRQVFWPRTWHLPRCFLNLLILPQTKVNWLCPSILETKESYFRLNSRVFLKSCFLHVFAECHNLICPLAIAPAAGDIHPTMRRLKFMALWHMVLSQRWRHVFFSVLTAEIYRMKRASLVVWLSDSILEWSWSRFPEIYKLKILPMNFPCHQVYMQR